MTRVGGLRAQCAGVLGEKPSSLVISHSAAPCAARCPRGACAVFTGRTAGGAVLADDDASLAALPALTVVDVALAGTMAA